MNAQPVWLPGQPWKPKPDAAGGRDVTVPFDPTQVYCGHRVPEPGCSGCGYEFPERDVDREKIGPVVEHLPTCYDGPLDHFADCECRCHERPWTQAELKSARSRAQSRAKTQLSHEFPWRYRELYYRELAKDGLTVVRPYRFGPTAGTSAREREVNDA